jgi:HD-like signal output (HDOD) protein
MNTEATNPTTATLRKIQSLALFDEDQLAELSRGLQVEKAKPKELIINIGDTGDYSIYLLSGEVTSIAHDGREASVKSEDNGHLQPLAQLRPSLYSIQAKSVVEYLCIDAQHLVGFSKQLHPESDSTEIEVTSIDRGDEANLLTMQLFQDIVDDKLTLPAMPDIALKIQHAFAGEDFDAQSIGKLIQSDPAMSAKILSVANSALYRGSDVIDSLQQAIVRLGMQTVRKLVLVFAAASLFKSKSPDIRQRMLDLWSDSRRLSAFSRLLAQRLSCFDAESAQMAGLLSDLGGVAILQYTQQYDELIEDPAVLEQTLECLSPQISAMLMQKWNLGPELIKVGEDSHNWFRNDSEAADMCDLVLVARYFSSVGSAKMKLVPALSKMPAFAKLTLDDFGVGEAIQFVKDSQAEVETIEAMLGSV